MLATTHMWPPRATAELNFLFDFIFISLNQNKPSLVAQTVKNLPAIQETQV